MRHSRAAVAAPLLVLALAGGCSAEPADSAGDLETGAGTISPTTASSDPATDAGTGTSPDSGATTATGSPSPAAADAPGSDTKYCRLLATDFDALFADVTGVESATAALDLMDRIAREAPAAVEPQWAAMEDSLDVVRKALVRAADLQKRLAAGTVTREEMGRETAELMQQMQQLDTPENRQAGEAVAAHAAEHCGLELGR